MYMIQCSQSEGIIFDTLSSGSFFKEAAGLLQQTGLKAMTNMRIIASHEHQDHTGGLSGVRNVQNLRNAEIIAQKNNDAVKQAQVKVGETQNEKCGDATIDLVHTQGHTTAGVMACTGGFCLAGDECEDSVPFIAQADNLNEQIRGLTKSIQTLRQLGASRVLQAHGNMQAVADGSLGLKVCESNLVYKKKMVNDFTTLCPNGSNISPKQLAKEINRNEGDITKEYLDVHNDNCDSVRQARRGR
ncbi:Beta-lactamase-like protein [Moelleriella libera RCEF 2490]|uniref:Beta-lactamase-like protein n=1 Tax=Moelleriella libera RCEF 2490 TaxID=1081109 RepID=A0A167WW67_9HYPO|nr:Beta-lactamase-like protein [Moelleriella libera RCEF 2490]